MSKVVAALQQAQAADLTGVTVQGLIALVKSADPPPKMSGGYPAREFGEWLKRRHLRGVGVDSEGVRYDYEAERARLTKAQADRTELEAAELRGEMLRAAEAVEEWGRMFGAMKARLLALPSKVAPRVRGAESDEVVLRLLEAEILQALQELSDDGLPARTRSRAARVAARATAAAQPDGEPVGGRLPKAEPRKRKRAGAVDH